MVTIYVIHSVRGGGDGSGCGGGRSDARTSSEGSCRRVVMNGFVCRFVGAHTVVRITVASIFWIVSVTIVAVVAVMVRVLIVICDGCFMIIFGCTLCLRFLFEFAGGCGSG